MRVTWHGRAAALTAPSGSLHSHCQAFPRPATSGHTIPTASATPTAAQRPPTATFPEPLCTATSRLFHSRFPQFPNFPWPLPGTLWNFIEYARYPICRVYKSSVINRVNYSSRGSLSRQEDCLHEMSCDLPKHRTYRGGDVLTNHMISQGPFTPVSAFFPEHWPHGKSCDFSNLRSFPSTATGHMVSYVISQNFGPSLPQPLATW
jgi:hypothetical protein